MIFGLLAVLLVSLLPQLTERERLEETGIELDKASTGIVGFALKENRLPCPDVSGDGLEGTGGTCAAGNAVGDIPWHSLDLPAPELDEARLPLRYGVYRNVGATADLVTLEDVFVPALPGRLTANFGSVDVCGVAGVQAASSNVVRISFDDNSYYTFELTNVSGTWTDDDPQDTNGNTVDTPGEYIGFGEMEYENLTADPPPSTTNFSNGDLITGTESLLTATVTSVGGGSIVGDVTDLPIPNGTTLTNETQAGSATVTAVDGSQVTADVDSGSFSIGDSLSGGLTVTAVISGSPDEIIAEGPLFTVLETVTSGNNVAVVTSRSATTVFAAIATGDCPCGTIVPTVCQTCPAQFTAGDSVFGVNSADSVVVANTTAATDGTFTTEFPRGVFQMPETIEVRYDFNANFSSSVTPVSTGVSADGISFTPYIAQIHSIVDNDTLQVELLDASVGTNFTVGATVTGNTNGGQATVTSVAGSSFNADWVSGVFEIGETVTDGSNTATVIVGSDMGSPAQITASDDNPVAGEMFAVGDVIYGAESGASGTITSIVPPSPPAVFDDDTPDVVSNGSGASGTVLFAGESSLLVEMTSGSFSEGDTITGSVSGASATVTNVDDSATVGPVPTPGSISEGPPVMPDPPNLNKLDFCKKIRNGFSQAGIAADTDYLHTVNEDSVAINAAYLLASGGVSNADETGDDNPGDIAFDGLNEDPDTVDFTSPLVGRGPFYDPLISTNYDDIVSTKPFGVLEERFQCSRSFGAVNALAGQAFDLKNEALIAFYLHEQSLTTIRQAYQAWQMAELNLELTTISLVINTLADSIGLAHSIMYFEGDAIGLAIEIANTAIGFTLGVLSEADAIDTVNSSISDFEEACSDQVDALAAAQAALAAAEEMLDKALLADQLGGVK